MTSAEAQARYLMALAAMAFSDEQIGIVSTAQVDDGEWLVELQRAIADLPPRRVVHILERLEANPSLLSDGTFDLGRILRLGPADADYMPIEEGMDG